MKSGFLKMMKNTFVAKIKIFERKKSCHYVSVPTDLSNSVVHLADRGLIPVMATIDGLIWLTSLLSMGDGAHFIAMLAKVRSKERDEGRSFL